MTASSIPMPRLPSAAVAAAAVWFGLAVLAGATGFLARLPFPGPQLIILTLVVATTRVRMMSWGPGKGSRARKPVAPASTARPNQTAAAATAALGRRGIGILEAVMGRPSRKGGSLRFRYVHIRLSERGKSSRG